MREAAPLETLREAYPDHPAGLLLRAAALQAAGDASGAARAYERAFEITPSLRRDDTGAD